MVTTINFISTDRGNAVVEREEERRIVLPQVEQDAASVVNRPPKMNLKKALFAFLAMVLLGIGGVAGYNFYQHMQTHQETDDAYVTGHLHQVSTRLPGTVSKVLVDDNEHVKAGQLLVMLDANDYQVKVNQARASLATAMEQSRVAQTNVGYAATNASGQVQKAAAAVSQAQAAIAQSQAAVIEAEAAVSQNKADLGAKEAEYSRAQADYKRFVKLESQGAVAVQELDTARRDFQVAERNVQSAKDKVSQAEAKLNQARSMVNTARAQLVEAQGQVVLAQASGAQTQVNERQFDVARTSIAQAKAALDEALLNLSYTNIYAPADGRIGKKTVEVGQRIEPGQPLLTVVSDETWLVANFKETQLKQMRPGDSVEIKIDSFPDHKFSGHVLSFSPGSGASFALLPSDNATGNFTKIVQRVPVKIVFDKACLVGYRDLLVPGMSAVTSVDVSKNVGASKETAPPAGKGK